MPQHYRAAIIGLGQIAYQIDKDPSRNIIWSHAEAYREWGLSALGAASDIDTKKIQLFEKHYPCV